MISKCRIPTSKRTIVRIKCTPAATPRPQANTNVGSSCRLFVVQFEYMCWIGKQEKLIQNGNFIKQKRLAWKVLSGPKRVIENMSRSRERPKTNLWIQTKLKKTTTLYLCLLNLPVALENIVILIYKYIILILLSTSLFNERKHSLLQASLNQHCSLNPLSIGAKLSSANCGSYHYTLPSSIYI